MSETKPRYRLGLDIGTTTGWALSANERIINSGTVIFKNTRNGHEGDRLAEFFQWLSAHWNGIHEVHYEKVIGFSGHTDSSFFNKMYGVLALWSSALRIPMIGINPMSLKKQFCGRGNAKKEEMCEFAIDLGWPHGERNTTRFHDEVDAIAILFVHLKERGYEPIMDYKKSTI